MIFPLDRPDDAWCRVLSGILPDGLSLSTQPLSVGGWPVFCDLLQSVSDLFLGGHHGLGQPGRLLLEVLRVFLLYRYVSIYPRQRRTGQSGRADQRVWHRLARDGFSASGQPSAAGWFLAGWGRLVCILTCGG